MTWLLISPRLWYWAADDRSAGGDLFGVEPALYASLQGNLFGLACHDDTARTLVERVRALQRYVAAGRCDGTDNCVSVASRETVERFLGRHVKPQSGGDDRRTLAWLHDFANTAMW